MWVIFGLKTRKTKTVVSDSRRTPAKLIFVYSHRQTCPVHVLCFSGKMRLGVRLCVLSVGCGAVEIPIHPFGPVFTRKQYRHALERIIGCQCRMFRATFCYFCKFGKSDCLVFVCAFLRIDEFPCANFAILFYQHYSVCSELLIFMSGKNCKNENHIQLCV